MKLFRKITLFLGLRKINIEDNWEESLPKTKNKLDLVLKFLAEHSEITHGFDDIFKGITESLIIEADVHRCLDKLVEEKYVGRLDGNKIQIQPIKFNIELTQEKIIQGKLENHGRTISSYYITLKGSEFYSKGGYTKEVWISKSHNQELTFKIVASTVGLFTLGLSLYSSCNNVKTSLKQDYIELRQNRIDSSLNQMESELKTLQTQKSTSTYNQYFNISRDSITKTIQPK